MGKNVYIIKKAQKLLIKIRIIKNTNKKIYI